MAYERSTRRHRRSAVGRAWLHSLLLSLPGILFVSILLSDHHIALEPALFSLAGLLIYAALVSSSLVDSLIRPLQTLSNVIASLREGDYSFRARGAGGPDALSELASEVNALADLLQKQRVRSLEATALLARILEVMHAPLFAFDRDNVLRLVNEAGLRMLGLPHARCYGRTAGDLGLSALLEAPDQSIHMLGRRATRWLLRKAAFRQDGAPHMLLLLADVSQPLQEEEQAAWKRLIRVLGHEISNSLTPIKSIAGSLLGRTDQLAGAEELVGDYKRGLDVIEVRADALHRFVQSYRALAQLPPPQLRLVEVAPLIERLALLERRVTVELERGPAIRLSADPDQLEQMLINLIKNAADASTANGSRPIRLCWRLEGSQIAILVEDCGLGIANSDNLFVPFYTTKPNGSGVGLALAQQIARAHGGEILLTNREEGFGARAVVHLPLNGPSG